MKRKKNIPFYILILIIFQPLLGAAKRINVMVKDQEGFPIEYVHLKVEVLVDKMLSSKMFLTNEEGKETIEMTQDFRLTITCFGFESIMDTIYIQEVSEDPLIYILKDKIFELDEVILTAQIDETNPEKAVQTVKIIDEKQIIAQGAVTLKDVLVTQQNVRLSQDLVLGSSMSLMGISGQNVKILIDGIPVVGRQDGNIDLSQINLNNVERIEIIEGPLSVNYGSDALAGTINIITKKKQKEKLKIGVNGYYETIGKYNLSVHTGVNLKKSHLLLDGGRNFFGGWSAIDTSRHKDWKPKEQYFANANYVYYSQKAEVRFKSSIFNEHIENRGYPRSPLYTQAFDDTYKTQRIDNGLFYNRNIGTHGRLDLKASYNYYLRKKNTYTKNLSTLEETLIDDVVMHDTSGFDLWMTRGTYNLSNDSSNLKYQLGYDFNRESAIGKRIFGKKQQMYDFASFVNVEWKLTPNLVAKPGVRLTYNSAYKAPVVPSLHLKWGNDFWVFRASYARGFRAPSIKDLYFDFVDVNHNIQGNPSLEVEHSHNYQVNAQRKIEGNKKQKLTLKVGTFYNTINNMITLAQVANSTEYSYHNIENYKTLGVQSNNTLNLKSTNISLGFSYIGRFNQLSQEYNVDPYSYYPEVLFNVDHTFNQSKIKIAIFGKYQGKYPSVFINEDSEIYIGYINPFTYADASVSRTFWKKQIQAVLGVKNVLNVQSVGSNAQGGTHSSSTSSTPISYGRTFFLSLNYTFKQKSAEFRKNHQ